MTTARTVVELPQASRLPLILVAGLAAPVAVLASTLDSVRPPVWLLVVTCLLGAGQAARPESGFGTAAGLLAMGWWGFGAPSEIDGVAAGALVAAAALVAGHIACLLGSYAPESVPLDPGLTGLWIARALFVMAPAVAAWLVALTVTEVEAPPWVWPVGGVVVLVALVAGQLAMPRLEDDRDE